VSEGLEAARAALADLRCWLVGGAVRDALQGRAGAEDIDLIVDGDVAGAARALAASAKGVAFELSDEWGAWRVVARSRRWQADLNPLRGESLDADLRMRDFTVNAIAQPLAGGELVDPCGGIRDVVTGTLRLVHDESIANDPLRALRLVRLACELEFEPDAAARRAAARAAPRLADVAAERVFVELRRILAADEAVAGLRLADELGLTAVVLPELDGLRGVEQNRFHHLDVHGHTLAVLEAAIQVEREPAGALGAEHADAVRELLARPLADGMTRAGGLRLGALLHDVAKPVTRGVTSEGRVIFPGHDDRGAAMARDALGRLRASERLCAHVAALTRHHLRLGFLVHAAPLSRRDVYRYLSACGPVAADVTLLSVADRLATRGDRAEESIARHLALASQIIGDALAWDSDGPPKPLIRGDQLAAEVGIEPGPRLGELLGELAEAQFAGEVSDTAQAVAYARARIS
jgi:poly(A) polymerase